MFHKKQVLIIAGLAAVIVFLSRCATTPQPPFGTMPLPLPAATATPVSAPSPYVPGPKVLPQYGWQPEYETIIASWLPKMPDLTANMTIVCPKWKTVNQKDVWVKFWKANIKCESGFNRAAAYVETAMGIDPVTHLQVASEGLLSLSYQDVPNYKLPECNSISYKTDAGKKPHDPTKTINDPVINLNCGMAIARQSVVRNPHYWGNHPDEVAFSNYWSCVRKGHSGLNDFKLAAPECK